MEQLSPGDETELDRVLGSLDPINVVTAERLLKEIKQVMDQATVPFFLRQGTCLGAIRDNAIIPWDDDIDVGSVFGLHVFSEEKVVSVARTLSERGFILKIERNDHCLCVAMAKESIRIEWSCYWVIDDAIFMYPGMRIPIHLLTDLKEVDFLGEKFLVPNPPEDYLEVKYGSEWRVPKPAGAYEEDILDLIPDTPAPGRSGRLKQFLTMHFQWWHAAKVQVLNGQGKSVNGARILVAGLGIFRAGRQGVIRLYIPRVGYYALVVTFEDHRGILYMEKVGPGQRYLYRQGEEHLLAIDGSG